MDGDPKKSLLDKSDEIAEQIISEGVECTPDEVFALIQTKRDLPTKYGGYCLESIVAILKKDFERLTAANR